MNIFIKTLSEKFKGDVVIIYDGDCPFCKNIMLMSELKRSFRSVDLVNARDIPNIVALCKKEGLDLNQGMIVLDQEKNLLFGGEALRYIGLNAPSVSFFSRFVSIFFSPKIISVNLYPFFRACRNITLKLLGHKKL